MLAGVRRARVHFGKSLSDPQGAVLHGGLRKRPLSASAELITANPQSGPVRIRSDYDALQHNLKGTNTLKQKRPGNSRFHRTADWRSFHGLKPYPRAAQLDRHATADIGAGFVYVGEADLQFQLISAVHPSISANDFDCHRIYVL
jgi:hypothetical protein